MSDRAPHIVIVGGGFGGLATAKALRNTPRTLLSSTGRITTFFSHFCIRSQHPN
jgi:NADH dehydrogenase FAD-containing subunit